jgi:VWFA-related protein
MKTVLARWTCILAAGLLAAAPASAVGLATSPAPAATGHGLKFIAPRHLATVLGPSTIELDLAPPAGLSVRDVRVSVDGSLVATLVGPPWKAVWDAGENGGDHLIEARAVFSDGSEAYTSLRTSRLRVDQIEEVAAVSVYAVAKDPRETYVTDLRVEEVRLEENGRPQKIQQFSSERRPLRIALVLDTSLSMKGRKLKAAREAALEFLGLLAPGDEGVVIGFSDRVGVLQELTGDAAELARAVRATEASGGTALYDAIWEASNLLNAFDGRRVLVLLSDGKDEGSSGLEPGSLHTSGEAVERALRNEVIVFAIGLGEALAEDAARLEKDPQASVEMLDFDGRRPLASILREVSDTTGGRAIFTDAPGKLRRAFEEVSADLRHQYALAYVSDDHARDGKWREIRLVVTRPGVTMANRKGYYAPKDRLTR